MANGSFYNYVKGSNESTYFGLYCEYTYTQNVPGNYTNVTVDVYIRYYSINLNSRSGKITINGTSTSFTSPAIKNYPSGGGGKTKIGSATTRVDHNNDGTKKGVGLSVSLDSQITYNDTWYSTLTASTTVDLPTIQRSSTINSFSGTNLSGSFSVSYTSFSGSFTNKLRISVPNVKALETFNYTSGTSFTLSQASLDYLYSYASNTDKVPIGAVIETWNGSTKIGESTELIHDCYIPDNIKPKVGTVQIDPVNLATQDGVSRNILVKNKNKMSISVSGSVAGAGSGIKSYTFEALKGSTVIASATTTSTSTQLGPFAQTGDLKFRVTVTDNRNRSTNNSGSELTCTCHDYNAPYLSGVSAYRANSDGSQNVNGTYLKCTYTPTYSSVNSTNNVTVTVHYNGNTSTSTLINLGEADNTYQVYLTVEDNYGGSDRTSTMTVFGQSRIFNITADGTGVAIGKMAESSQLFECRWNAKFDGTASGPSGFSTSSDERVKKNIQDIDIDIVDNLRPIQYELVQSIDGKTHYGFIAQEVESLLFDSGVDPNSTGIIGHILNNGQQEYVLTYTEFIPLLTKKCQSLQSEVDMLKLEIEKLKETIQN